MHLHVNEQAGRRNILNAHTKAQRSVCTNNKIQFDMDVTPEQ